MQGALSSSSTLDQLQAFARMAHQDHADDQDLAWQVLFLALRAGHTDVAVKVCPQHCVVLLLLPIASKQLTLPQLLCVRAVLSLTSLLE